MLHKLTEQMAAMVSSLESMEPRNPSHTPAASSLPQQLRGCAHFESRRSREGPGRVSPEQPTPQSSALSGTIACSMTIHLPPFACGLTPTCSSSVTFGEPQPPQRKGSTKDEWVSGGGILHERNSAGGPFTWPNPFLTTLPPMGPMRPIISFPY